MMNQLRQMFGLSVLLTSRSPLRGSSIVRSAGTSGKDRNRPGEVLVADASPEVKLSGRSYAKIIAEYSREIEERSVASKFNGDGKAGGIGAGFFSGTAFERLTRVSSLVRIKTGRNSAGPSLCTKSSSGPPINPAKIDDDRPRNKATEDGKSAFDVASERAELLDKVKAHEVKRATTNESRPRHSGGGGNVAHPLVQRMAKTTPRVNAISNEFRNVSQISPAKNKSDVPLSDTRNVSVVVKRLKESDVEKNAFPMTANDDKNAMLVTLSEESKHSLTSSSNPLRHVNLRINGKPALGVESVISKVEKLDVVSSAEKIEIRIPVSSEATGDKSRAPNSTINVYISSRGAEAAADRGTAGEVGQSGDSGSGGSRSGFSHRSTFILPKVRNFRRNDKFADRSKVVPWWTTEDSFRTSETVPVGSAEDSRVAQISETKTSVTAAAVVTVSKEVASDSGLRAKPPVTKPVSLRQPLKGRRNTPAVSKIIEESMKKSEQQRDERWMHRSPLERLNDAMPQAEPNVRVKTSASNEPKKDARSIAVGSKIPGKSPQAGSEPTPDNMARKISPPFGVDIATSARDSKTASKPTKSEDIGRNNNLSTANDSRGRIHAKPISEIGAVRTKDDSHGVTSSGQVSRVMGSDRVGSEIGTKPLQEVSSESKRNDALRPPGTHGKMELLPSRQSPAEPAKQPRNGRGASIKPNDNAVYTAEKLSNAKNLTAAMRPIEKKKDGTLIDYGATVTTRKKLERKLSGSRSTNGVQRKKIAEQEEPVVVATIKEVIPRRNRNVGGDAFNRNTEVPGSGKNGPDKNRCRMHVARDHCRSLQKKCNKITPKETSNEANESGTSRTHLNKEKRNSEASNESRVVETVTPDKKLLYSVWLRRFKERTGQDPDPTKDPKSRGA